MNLGADDYITKPFDSRELMHVIAQRLHKFDVIHNAWADEVDQLRNYLNKTLPHELRTPLTGLLGYIGYIEWLQTDVELLSIDELKNILSRMDYSAARLYRLVENHLLHAQLSTAIRESDLGERLTRLGGCDVPAAVITSATQKVAHKHGCETDLHFNISNATVAILPDNLQKIVEELTDNACKFSTPGSTIEITGKPQGSHYTIVIQDHGRGMQPEHIALIGPNRQFERQKYEQQGIGLGLTIVMQMIKIYQGEIKIESQLDQGTTITIQLPNTL